MQFREQQAIYLQIVEYVCEQILLGKWPASERIPSVRELAIALEVNPNTIMRAYEILQEEGICINKRGVGFFTDDNAVEKVKHYKKSQFIKNETPTFFKSMYLLQISIQELETLYNGHIKNLKHISKHENL